MLLITHNTNEQISKEMKHMDHIKILKATYKCLGVYVTIFSNKTTFKMTAKSNLAIVFATKTWAVNVRDQLPDFVTGRDKGPGCVDGCIVGWGYHLNQARKQAYLKTDNWIRE